MSNTVMHKAKTQNDFLNTTSAVCYRSNNRDRMNGVIVEKYKKRCCNSSMNTFDLLAKEEACCNIATD